MAHDPDTYPCCGCGILTAQDDPAWGTVTLCAYCDPDEADAARCVVCGEPADYCQGHGPTGDPYGWQILAAHDDGDHERCHPAGCDAKRDALAVDALAILTADRCTVHGIARCTICHVVTR